MNNNNKVRLQAEEEARKIQEEQEKEVRKLI